MEDILMQGQHVQFVNTSCVVKKDEMHYRRRNISIIKKHWSQVKLKEINYVIVVDDDTSILIDQSKEALQCEETLKWRRVETSHIFVK